MSNNKQFAKVFEAVPSQILITKMYPNPDGNYGIKITCSAIIEDVPVAISASMSHSKMDEKEMDALFDSMNEDSTKEACNDLFGSLFNEPF